jgi:hypothetical protein
MTDNAVEDKSRVMDLQSVLTCPKCGHQSVETMPIDACQFFYDCKGCGARLKPLEGRLLRVLLLRLAALPADADRPLLVSADSSIDADQRGVEAGAQAEVGLGAAARSMLRCSATQSEAPGLIVAAPISVRKLQIELGSKPLQVRPYLWATAKTFGTIARFAPRLG